MTLEELKANALGELGLMTDGSYDDFMLLATEAVTKRGVTRPRLVVGLVYNDPRLNLVGAKETPYPIGRDEWDTFVSEIGEIFESAPCVYVVDGDKFTAPI